MKNSKIIVLILIAAAIGTNLCQAKTKGLDENQPSVQLLKTLVNEGKETRKDDVPVQKSDISEDITQVKDLKQQYYEENKKLLDVGKKNK